MVKRLPAEIFPEYFLIRVNEFNKVAVTPLEEWIEYLKTGHIRPDTTAPGLEEARKKLIYYNMEPTERFAYDRHIDAIMIQNDVLGTARDEGIAEGWAEGLALGKAEGKVEGKALGKVEGRTEAIIEIARNLKKSGTSVEVIVQCTGLSATEIESL